MLLGNGLHGLLGHILVEAGNEIAICHREDLLPNNDCLFDFGGQQHAYIQHDLEEQILRRAVFLYVVGKQVHLSLLEVLGAVVDVPHVGGVHSEDTEAGVKAAGSQRRFLTDFLSGSTDALFANVTDGGIACFYCNSTRYHYREEINYLLDRVALLEKTL